MDNLHKTLLNATFSQTMVLAPDGTVTAANDQMCKRLGIERNRLVGRSVFRLFPQDMALRWQRHLATVVGTGKGCHFQDTTAGDNVFEAVLEPVIHADSNVDAIVISLQDITASKKAEAERFRLATAIQQAMEAIIILDEEMHIQYVNQSFEHMTGFSQKEARGRKLEMLFKGLEQENLLSNVVSSLRHGDTWAGRTSSTRKNGDTFQSELTIVRIRGKRFMPMGFVTIWRDVTDMTLLEKQLRQAQKMEAIGTLASGIAHDFNNILGPIILHTEVSLARHQDIPQLRESLEEILNSANRARQLVEQILGLSRGREADKPLPFRVGAIAKECLKILRASLNTGIDIHYNNQSEEDVIRADPTQMHQVLLNLCTNAAQAMGDSRGLLEITLSDMEVNNDTRRSFPMLRPGHYLCLSVADDGQGIPRENLEEIFEPFFTTKKEGVGTGLGLTVVRNIVTGMGGTVMVESEPKKGTEFKVYLPKCVNCEVSPTQKQVIDNDRHSRVLLVDDDEVTVRGLRENLLQLGYDVTHSRNGYEALALFRQDPEHYSLVMIDVATPELNGLELAKEIKLSRFDLPVILLTAYTELFPPRKAQALGVQAFLRKPCLFEELSDILAKVQAAIPDHDAGGY
ncbi:PAS domain-containing sensor histidine kinase [Pseudodesulfovibrio senegalensis]|jgi:PAS domain S-box-containing protein|nr:PAS domain-containing sensor histidine kinase [Pseudodesulfovibrio senegalensis]